MQNIQIEIPDTEAEAFKNRNLDFFTKMADLLNMWANAGDSVSIFLFFTAVETMTRQSNELCKTVLQQRIDSADPGCVN